MAAVLIVCVGWPCCASAQDEAAPTSNTTTSDIAPTLMPEDVQVANVQQLVDVSEEMEGFEDLRVLVETFGVLSFRRDAESGESLEIRARFDPEEQISVAAFTVWVSTALDWMSGFVDFAGVDADGVGYIIDIRPLMGFVDRGSSTLRPLVDRVEPNAANWYNDKVMSFPQRWADDGEAEPIDITDEEAQQKAEEELNAPRPDPARALTVGQVRRIVLEHFGVEPGPTPYAVDVPATRRYAAVCLSQALQKRAKQLERAIIKVRLIPSKVFRDEMLRAHGIDLAEGHDGVFDGTQPLTRRDAARWLIAAHDKSNEYARKAVESVDNPSQRKVLALREMRDARAMPEGADVPGVERVTDLDDEGDRLLFQQLLERKVWLVDAGEDAETYRFNAHEAIRPVDFERLIVAMYGLRGSLDLDQPGEALAALDLAQALKQVMDFHKADIEKTLQHFREKQGK